MENLSKKLASLVVGYMEASGTAGSVVTGAFQDDITFQATIGTFIVGNIRRGPV